MAQDAQETRHFEAILTREPSGSRVVIVLPFDPDAVWGAKPRHPLAGTINGIRYRGNATSAPEGWSVPVGAAWRRDNGLDLGDAVTVALAPEGPQRGTLAPDIAAALAAEPNAASFFDGLAQFYRRAYLEWVEATRTRPEERSRRLAEMIGLLKAGRKSRD